MRAERLSQLRHRQEADDRNKVPLPGRAARQTLDGGGRGRVRVPSADPRDARLALFESQQGE